MSQDKLIKNKTLVLGASPKEDRYSNLAVKRLKATRHPVIALGNAEGSIDDTPIQKNLEHFEDIHTVTMYVGAKNQPVYYDYIISLMPERVIFNPGTENPEFYAMLDAKGISHMEACTLVMLNTGQY